MVMFYIHGYIGVKKEKKKEKGEGREGDREKFQLNVFISL